ncbi:hypothetical protein HYU12_02155 [Candidatus Woesearchaeota archaeon]|nr:hypothetical protein [Candidatus Woesearchaeota archaeon]
MVSITVSVPNETRQLMELFPEMNWSGFVRKSIEEKAKELSWKDEMLKKLSKDKLFSEWAVSAGRLAKKGRFGRVLEELSAKERESLKR